jgi:NADPH:quinone reductase-like Zn-dependent oxidoreductase
MRAAVVHEVGTFPVFDDFKEPQGDDGHEVAEVVCAGLNPVDLYIVAGQYGPVEPPFVAGLEGIARIGGNGRRVYFNGVPKPFGAMAAEAPIDPSTCFDVPDGLDHGVAVALGIAGLAAWLPLEARARLKSGETVLVIGATGVVGQIGVQAARLLGAGRVVAAGRNRAALERLRELGADEIVVLEGDLEQAFAGAAGDGYDVVLDTIYGPPLEAALPATATGSRIVTVGAAAGTSIDLPVGSLFGRTLIGHSNGHVPVDVRRAAYERMARHAAAGELKIEVEALPLSQIEDAWRKQAEGPHHKIVLVP